MKCVPVGETRLRVVTPHSSSMGMVVFHKIPRCIFSSSVSVFMA